MENSPLSFKNLVVLSYNQADLAHVIIRSEGFLHHQLSKEHIALEEKMQSVKRHARTYSHVSMHFSEEERKLMREYNINYCERLAINMQNADGISRSLNIALGKNTYILATQIYFQFSSKSANNKNSN